MKKLIGLLLFIIPLSIYGQVNSIKDLQIDTVKCFQMVDIYVEYSEDKWYATDGGFVRGSHVLVTHGYFDGTFYYDENNQKIKSNILFTKPRTL